MISVVIPTLEEEKYLPFLLEDLKRQSCQPDEVIVVDAGSRDNTSKIAKRLGAKLIVSNVRSAAVQRNIGAKKAIGDIIIFLDADIRLFDRSVISQAEDLLKDSAACIARVDVLHSQRKIQDSVFCFFPNTFAIICPRFAGRGAFIALKKDAFNSINGFDERRAVTEDVELIRRIAKKGRVSCIRARVEESPRRYRRLGHLTVLWGWCINAAWAGLTGHSIDKEWRAIR